MYVCKHRYTWNVSNHSCTKIDDMVTFVSLLLEAFWLVVPANVRDCHSWSSSSSGDGPSLPPPMVPRHGVVSRGMIFVGHE